MIALLVFIIGCCVGSFLNVCIYRLPREISIVRPFSFCPLCKAPIKWHDNIPLVGYLLLKGRCRSCGGRISLRYFFIELITAILFVAAYRISPNGWAFVNLSILYSICIIVSFVDIDYRAIPDYLCVLGIFAALTVNFVQTIVLFNNTLFIHIKFSDIPIVNSLMGIFIGIGFVYFFKLMGDFGFSIYLNLAKKDSIDGEKETLGLGDVDFIGMVGAFLGWKMAILTFFIAPLISLFYGVYIIIRKKSHIIAYLPFLSVGAVIASIWGGKILGILFNFY